MTKIKRAKMYKQYQTPLPIFHHSLVKHGNLQIFFFFFFWSKLRNLNATLRKKETLPLLNKV